MAPEPTASLTAPAERRVPQHAQAPRERFAPLWLRASVILATLVTLALLYPKSYIEKHLGRDSHPSAATLAYLRLMVLARPSALDARMLLAEQALAAGELSLARAALAPWRDGPISTLPLGVALLRLHLLRAELDATQLSSMKHRELAHAYTGEVLRLAPRMDPAELLPAARFTAALGEPRSAARLYRRIIATIPDATLRLAAFRGGIQALLSAGRPRDALAFAQHELPLLPRSAALWREMTRLALMADEPELAARYARRLIGLKAP